jgi:hypothetical protein
LSKDKHDATESCDLLIRKRRQLDNTLIQLRSILDSSDNGPSKITELRRIATELSEDGNDSGACCNLIKELILSLKKYADVTSKNEELNYSKTLWDQKLSELEHDLELSKIGQ